MGHTRQVRLVSGAHEAEVSTVGASLRRYRADGVDVVLPFGPADARPGMSGAVLAPWPNRTAGAGYSFGGSEYRLPMNDAASGAASHGLVADAVFEVVALSQTRAVLTHTIAPTRGYPWRILLEVEYALGVDGLRQSIGATNLSERCAPIGLGAHPYAVVGERVEKAIDCLSLHVPAERVLLIDERALPATLIPTADDHRLDFRGLRPIGATQLNHAFTSLRPDGDGGARVRVRDVSGAGVEVELGEGCAWVQIYTGDFLDPSRSAIAIEPMTCAPDALNSGRGLRILRPGETCRLSWSVRRLRG